MLWPIKANGVARIEVDNDDFLVTAPTLEDLEMLSRPPTNWDIAIQTLSAENAINTVISNANDRPMAFQHEELKLTKFFGWKNQAF